MIKIYNKNDQVVIDFNLGLNCKRCILLFTRNEGYEYQAELVAKQLNKRLEDNIQSIRKKEYVEGFKDGRGHKSKKTWFSRWF